MENAKIFLFTRWISTCYADEHLDNKMRHTSSECFDASAAMSVLNKEDGHWWKKQLEHFNDVVWPNYIENGSAINAKEFLKDIKNDVIILHRSDLRSMENDISFDDLKLGDFPLDILKDAIKYKIILFIDNQMKDKLKILKHGSQKE
jgi:hypothetical protein